MHSPKNNSPNNPKNSPAPSKTNMPPNMAPAIFAPLGLLSSFSSFLHKHLLQTSIRQAQLVRLPPPAGLSSPPLFLHQSTPNSLFTPIKTLSYKPSAKRTSCACPCPAGLPFPIHIIFQLLLSVLYLPPLLNPLATKRHPAFAPACGAFLSLKKRPIFFSSPKTSIHQTRLACLPPPAGLSLSIAPHPPAFYAKPPLTGTLRPFTHRTHRPHHATAYRRTHRPQPRRPLPAAPPLPHSLTVTYPQPRRFIHDTHRPTNGKFYFPIPPNTHHHLPSFSRRALLPLPLPAGATAAPSLSNF